MLDYVSVSGEHGKFKFFIVLNLCQSLAAIFVSWLFLTIEGSGIGSRSKDLLGHYFKCAVANTLASPFGYRALQHINYPTMILGKSCKLVPVMLMNFLVYRKKFETYKYFTVFLITLGVSGFMLMEPHRGSRNQVVKEVANNFYGLLLLVINLLIDGATNSWQDQIFQRYKVKSQQMMFWMNLFGSCLMALWLLNPFNSELSAAIQFGLDFPSVIPDLASFAFCSAFGQVFIFYTLEKFGSLSLVTITVTRKLFTILISLFWFDHHLNTSQWLCVLLVFIALGIESFAKKGAKTVKPANQ